MPGHAIDAGGCDRGLRVHTIVGPQHTSSEYSGFAPDLPKVGVLIVDDDDDGRELLAGAIRRAGYSAVTARDGREALDALHACRPDLILLDVIMPIMDGASFRQQQRRNREWIRIPTIVMTGAADEPMLDVVVEEALRKPISSRKLLELVAGHCTKS